MSAPPKTMRPPCAGVTPQMVLTSVVLPAPFGPIRPSTSPLLTASVTPFSARKPEKCRETFSRRKISDMISDMPRPPPKPVDAQRDQAMRQKQQQQYDEETEHAGVDLDVIAPDHL